MQPAGQGQSADLIDPSQVLQAKLACLDQNHDLIALLT